MKARWFVFVLVAVSLLASSCKSKPTLVGEWTGTLLVQGLSLEMDFQFGADGNVTVKQSAMGQSSTQKGTYKEEEKSFTMTPTSIESPALPKATLDKINAELAKNPKTVTFTLEWMDADTISVTQQGAPAPLNVAITLKRKKV